MKNMNLIYAATDAAQYLAKTSADISMALARYLDVAESVYEEATIEKIRELIDYCACWQMEVFNGILEEGEIVP